MLSVCCRYHKNNLSKEELEAVIVGLQKKVKILQQRHRRQVEKLAAMETIVKQLKKENLISEEKLKMLEMAYLQAHGMVTETGDALAIICEDDKTTYLYTVPQSDEDEENVINMSDEQLISLSQDQSI
ncbi:THAP domain-containing protein 5-like [Polypterus senegalus]|uniref:THAP domain-containing protein 5-like n=1 Tax=Polypterus senegalus TaxID=55291 RepID=UPI001962AA4B|nr:THAP domain-containing protein 5-like [Polypterus senegalus]